MGMNDPIRKLPADALLALSGYLDDLSKQAATLGETKDRRAARQSMAARKAAFLDAAQIVEHYASHMSLERAVRIVADQTGIPVETVAIHVRLRARERKRRSLFERDRRILALARKGQSNKEIGERLGLHPGSVSRIIQKALATAAGR